MKPLNITLPIWYKTFHVFFACAWFGAVLAVIIVYVFTPADAPFTLLINNSQLIEKVDQYIIIPSSLICYLFGILLSWKTNWGFFKFKWIAFKLITGTALLLFGIFFLGPWILQSSTAVHLDEPLYRHLQNKLGVSMILQAFVIAVTLIVSTTKPWGKLKKR